MIIRFQIQHMQHYAQHDMQHSNPHTPHPQGLGWVWVGRGWPLGMGYVGVRMLHIMLCIVLHVLDQEAYAFARCLPRFCVVVNSVLGHRTSYRIKKAPHLHEVPPRFNESAFQKSLQNLSKLAPNQQEGQYPYP